MNTLACQYAEQCAGCPWIKTKYSDQLLQKKTALNLALNSQGIETPPTELLSIQTHEIRDRVDLTIKNVLGQMRVGFFNAESKEILDIEFCLQMSPNLNLWYQEFRKALPPINQGSVRLRVSPNGERGIWLDFANLDVKNLLEEKTWLSALMGKATVEIGQKRKVLGIKEDRLRLLDSEPKKWFETYDANGLPIPIYSAIGGFTQTGFAANKKLVATILDFAKSTKLTEWTELFCGSGNFTLALASLGYNVTATENDELALSGLAASLKDHPDFKIEVIKANAYSNSGRPEISMTEGLLVDPPRSGLRQLIDQIGALNVDSRPKAIIYVSCFSDSFFQPFQ